MLEGGTQGSRGHTLVVLPHLTESYEKGTASADGAIPLCTLKNFPHRIEHTLQVSAAFPPARQQRHQRDGVKGQATKFVRIKRSYLVSAGQDTTKQSAAFEAREGLVMIRTGSRGTISATFPQLETTGWNYILPLCDV